MDVILPSNLPALNARIFCRAQRDVPQFEIPVGSNRSPWIDGLCRKYGVPLGSPWCALQAAEVWSDAGAEIPPVDDSRGMHPAMAESWRLWALATLRFSSIPEIGCAVLYGRGGRGPASHIGSCLASLTPYLTDFEGNSRLPWMPWTRDGELYTLQLVNTDHLIGYVHPQPQSGVTHF